MRAALLLTFLASTAQAQECGGPLNAWLDGVKSEATANGIPANAADSYLNGASIDEAVLRADRSQTVFQKDFLAFSRALISQNRIDNGRANAQRQDAIFDRIEAEFGIPRGVLLAFWAFETDYGAVQGGFNTRNALVTLAHDCRRPDLFRPQLLAAIQLHADGKFPTNLQGAWAGEIGQVQMLPEDIIEYGRDGDGDGQVDLKGSSADALLSGAQTLSALGWQPNQPWLQEITVPQNLDWSQTGLDTRKSVGEWKSLGITAREGSLGNDNLQAAILLPMGRNGPAFMAYPNFDVYFEWNKSFVYVTTAAYFGTRLNGASPYNAGNPTPALSGEEITRLQEKLTARGFDVGGIDGILGAMTRAAVQSEQQRLGLPADAWPTRDLLNAL